MFSTLRIAVRSLVRRPVVAIVAVVSLAMGIGVNSAVFSAVDNVFLRPPAVADPETLVQITAQFKDSGSSILDWADCREIAGQVPAFAAMTCSMGRGGGWRNGDEMIDLLVYAVGDNYFEMLGVKPVLGTLPNARYDYDSDPEPPIVLAYWIWRERMGGRPDIIGQRMEYRDHFWRVAAVLPPDFHGLYSLDQRHVWIPMSGWARYFRGDLERGSGQFGAIARLRTGVTLEQAQAQLDLLANRIEASDSRVTKGRRLAAISIAREARKRLLPGIFVMGAVLLVLLVACANVAAVLLARAESRRREIGLRLSLGASRLALVRQFLSESIVLALAGAAAGLFLASWLLSSVPFLAPPSTIPLKFDFRLDLRVLLFTAACSILTLVTFGLAPLAYALRVWPGEAISGLRVSGRTPRSFLRNGLVCSQIALSVVLAGGAVVFLRALREARDIYPGYDTARPLALISASVDARAGTKSEAMLFSEAAERVGTIAGVEGVTWARHLPLTDSGGGASISVIPEGAPADAPPRRVYFNLVGPKFFEITGTRLISGRAFADADHSGGIPVAIINAEAAQRFWPGQRALGKIIRTRKDTYEVAGIAADGRIGSLHEMPVPAVYLPGSRMRWGEALIIARTKADPAPIVKELGGAAAQVTGLRIRQSITLRTVMQRALYSDWIPTVLGAFLAIIGLLLAAGGLYGAVSYATERRQREFGIRLALGAKSSQIGKLVLRQAALLCIVGVPAGVGLFVMVYRYYAGALLRDRPMDPLAIAVGAIITAAAVLAGSMLPAMRASRVDPAEVLRAE